MLTVEQWVALDGSHSRLTITAEQDEDVRRFALAVLNALDAGRAEFDIGSCAVKIEVSDAA